MDVRQKIKKYKKEIFKFNENGVHIIQKKILPKRLSTSLFLLFIGTLFYYLFIHDKNINGGLAIIIASMIYIFLGIGLYGLFTWLFLKLFHLFIYIVRLILKGEIQISISNGKISSKIFYK
jgi:hypothetical protein